MTINELKEKRSKLLLEAQAILLASPDTEKRSSANAMIADSDILEADIKSLERIAAFETEERSRTTPARPVPGAGTETEAETRSKLEKRSFEQYIRYGRNDGHLTENRDLTTSTAGNFVPQSYIFQLVEALKSYGNVLNVITQVDVDNGAPAKYGSVNDVGSLLTNLATEVTAVTEVDPTVSGAIISTDFLSTGVIKVSIAELTDSAFSLDTWIRSAFGKRYYRGLSKLVTNGDSGNIGSLKTTATVGATSAAPTAIAWADIVSTFAALDPAYEQDAKWSMNATTRGLLLGVVDSLGRPLYVPSVTADSFDMILGHQVVMNPFMDNATAGLFPILYGDHSAYMLRNVKPGLSIMRLNELYAATGEVGFIGYARAGGALLSGGVPPIVSLEMHA